MSWDDRATAEKAVQVLKDEIIGYPWEQAGLECWLKRIVLVKGRKNEGWCVLLDCDTTKVLSENAPDIYIIQNEGILVEGRRVSIAINYYNRYIWSKLWDHTNYPCSIVAGVDPKLNLTL